MKGMGWTAVKAFCLCLIFLFSATCDKDTTEIVLEYAAVNGWIYGHQDEFANWSYYREGIVAGHPAPKAESTWVLLSVNIFYDTLALSFPEVPVPGALVYADSVPLLHNTTYRFSVASNIGTCMGEAQMPDAFFITDPEPESIFDFGEDISVIWSESPGADWYSVEISLRPYNPDTGWFGSRDTVYAIESAATVIHAEYMDDTLATYVGVEVVVVAHGGPMPDEEGNLSGELEGYFTASMEPFNNSIELHVGVAPPVAIARPPRGRDPARLIRTLMDL
jgi:hypothetical protein